MAARKSTRVNRKYKTKYRVANWREYERGLRSRGDITVWFSDEAREAWTPPNNGRRGGQPRYSNLPIVTALTLRMVFRLPLRQTEGFLDSLLRLMDLIDSPIKRFTADGAYDTRPVYELLGEVGTADIKIVIPPRRGAVPLDGAAGTWAQRNATLETIRNVGRQGWQRESRYRRQGAVENLFFRYKRTLGNRLLARGYESQKREARIGCNVLNRMAELGKPESQAIVGE